MTFAALCFVNEISKVFFFLFNGLFKVILFVTVSESAFVFIFPPKNPEITSTV